MLRPFILLQCHLNKALNFLARSVALRPGYQAALYGAFTLGQQSDMRVLIAGGVGITPMISMIRTLADRGDRQPMIQIYGSKDWESITFREELTL